MEWTPAPHPPFEDLTKGHKNDMRGVSQSFFFFLKKLDLEFLSFGSDLYKNFRNVGCAPLYEILDPALREL